MKNKQTLIFGGDFTLGKDPEFYMQGVNDLLDRADIRMFQLEEPFLEELVENAPPERHTSTLSLTSAKPVSGIPWPGATATASSTPAAA